MNDHPDDLALRTFGTHRRRLLDLARGLTGSRWEAEDIVQDAWLRVDAGRLPAHEAVSAWLHAIVRNLALDRLRRQRLERDWLAASLHDGMAGRDAAAPSCEDLADLNRQAAAALRLVTDRLAPVAAAAVLLREVFDADYADIAAACGKSEAACRQLVHRALQRVRATAPDTPVPEDRDAADALFSVCWRAVQSHRSAALMALLAAPATSAQASMPPLAGHGNAPARSHCALMQVAGRFAVVLVFDGQVLCTLPVGPADSSLPDQRALCGAT
jgi:RNA polymerase sigma-70 factor (ECF subfamily)